MAYLIFLLFFDVYIYIVSMLFFCWMYSYQNFLLFNEGYVFTFISFTIQIVFNLFLLLFSCYLSAFQEAFPVSKAFKCFPYIFFSFCCFLVFACFPFVVCLV